MRLWLDDLRPAPAGWHHVLTASEAIASLEDGRVVAVSLDHDLGDDEGAGNGYQVACWIEQAAAEGRLGRIDWALHTANPVGRAKMEAALRCAERWWDAGAYLDDEAPEERLLLGERIHATLDDDLLFDAQATAAPWIVWDGPEYLGGGRDVAIGAWDSKWITNMDHRMVVEPAVRHEHARTGCDPGNTDIGLPGSCPICSFGDEITAEQAANARFIVAARTRWPERVRQLREALDRDRSIGIAAGNAHYEASCIEDPAARAEVALGKIQSLVFHLLPGSADIFMDWRAEWSRPQPDDLDDALLRALGIADLQSGPAWAAAALRLRRLCLHDASDAGAGLREKAFWDAVQAGDAAIIGGAAGGDAAQAAAARAAHRAYMTAYTLAFELEPA